MNVALAALASIVVSFVVAPMTFVALASWKWSSLDAETRPKVLRSMLSAGTIFAVVAAIVAGISALSGNAVVTFVVPTVVTAVLCAWSISAAMPMRKVERLGALLDDRARRALARQELLQLCDGHSPTDTVGKSIRVSIAVTLSNAGCLGEARKALEGVDPEGFEGHEQELYSLTMLACLVHTGELERARELLSGLPPLTEGSTHECARRFSAAHLLLKESKPDEALALIRDEMPSPVLERNRHVVLAHVHAARGDEAALEAALAWLESNHGRAAVERVLEPEGPATARAWARLNQGDGPYRR